MKHIITLAFALTAVLFIEAQPTPTGHLTIFSEDGDKFFLVLNGERQNNEAQTNLRIEDLNQPYYNAKVIFADQSLAEISKNYLQITDVDGIYMDVTYKIKKDKNGKPKLNYFSMIPVRQGYVAPSNVTVVHYGAPATAVVVPTGSTTVTQTTTTRSTTDAVNVNVGMPGIGMNVTITDPLAGEVTSTTTTTHTTTTSSSGYTTPAPTSQAVAVGCNGSFCMAPGDFQSALNSISKQGFEETKLSTAKSIAGKQCLNAGQIVQICKTFGFEQSKLDFAKFAYARCIDPANYFKVNDVFGFSSSVEELNAFTSNH